PQVRNALNRDLCRAIPEAVIELEERADVAVIVLTGADPAFCAGLDLTELGSGDDLLSRGPHRTLIPSHRVPLIGGINGAAVTGGLELALGCDFLVGSDRATFADTHAQVGVMPDWGMTVLLPAAVGIRRAREMSATGRHVDAVTALRWGLLDHVVAHD